MSAVPYQDVEPLSLMERQEFSRTANGRTIGKSFGSPLWRGSWTTGPLPHDAALDFEAQLHLLDGVIGTFYAGDLRVKPYPSLSDGGVQIHTVGSNGDTLRLKGLPPGFVLPRGRYLSFDYGDRRAFHQVVEGATASGGGITPLLRVRPHVRPGAVIDLAVKLNKPEAEFSLDPGSVSKRLEGALHTVISFSGTQVL